MNAGDRQADLALALEARDRTDYLISAKWVWASVVGYITWAAIPIISYSYGEQLGSTLPALLGILGIVAFAFSGLSSYLVYLLVNRRNTHFAREETLLWRAFDSAKTTTQQADVETQVALASAEHDLARLSETVKEHSAVLWALLTLVPYTGWIAMTYVLAFLSHDISKHEQREGLVIEDLARVTRGLPQRSKKVPKRPIILYVLAVSAAVIIFLLPSAFKSEPVVVYIIAGFSTLTVPQLLWLYQAVKDPNSHFEYHRMFEPVIATRSTLVSS